MVCNFGELVLHTQDTLLCPNKQKYHAVFSQQVASLLRIFL